MKIRRTIKSIGNREQGIALLLTIVAVAVMGFLGATFAMMVSNEARSVNSGILAQQALYVAESGIQDILFQRSKMPDQLCFPFYYYDATKTQAQRLAEITSLTGFNSGGIDTAPLGTCDPTVDSIPSTTSVDEMPCWPYNEALYANTLEWAPYDCHDGSDTDVCPTYAPLLWWPASSTGGIGWKDWEESNSNRPLSNAKQSSGARYTTGFFTLCTDDFAGIADDSPGYDVACIAAKNGGVCPRSVFRLTLVSVGEVQSGDKVVRRAVKTDMSPPALYSGVIDKYVDMTLMYQTNINGAVHINGWWNGNKWNAFLITMSASLAPILTLLDPPELVSVSYPEDPANPDWQPSSILGLSLAHDILYVHLPVRIEIPQVNWKKWEDRMEELYDKARSEYDDSTVYKLRYCEYPDTGDVKSTRGDCPQANDDGGWHNALQKPGVPWNQKCTYWKSHSDEDKDNIFPCYDCPNNAGDGRIHNCNRKTYQVWNKTSKYIFDLFDPNSGSWVTGQESADVHNAVSSGPMDGSLKLKAKFMLNPDFGLGCLSCAVLGLIGGGSILEKFVTCCIGSTELRHAFAFMGKHEFRDFVFIDGMMGIGTRTPYHSCGTGDGSLGVYCIVIPEIDVFGLFTIPSWQFGLPHWHLGTVMVTGEVLVNGRLYMADWIKIEGGTIYASSHIIKDESSGMDIILHLDKLFCSIFKLIGLDIEIDLGITKISVCGVVMAILNPILAGIFPWWPTIDLTNNGFIDFETYLDINGATTSGSAVINPGTLYTRGDFRYMKPKWDVVAFAANTILSLIVGDGVELKSSVDPIRIYNGGAIVAGGKATGGDPSYKDGNIFLDQDKRMDILTYDPVAKKRSVGYVLARGGLNVWSDIISHYGGSGFFDSCSTSALSGLDPDCAAAGIFYSGGVSAGTDPVNMIGRRSLNAYGDSVNFQYKPLTGILASLPVGDTFLKPTCLDPEETSFWADTDNVMCWLSGLTTDVLGGNASEFNIRGHVFAGAVGAMPATHFRLDQDGPVRHDAVTRQYFKQLGGVPLDWMEIDIPPNLGYLPLQ
jgi:hypothetical protein